MQEKFPNFPIFLCRKMTHNWKVLTEDQVKEALQRAPISLHPLDFVRVEPSGNVGDAVFNISWKGRGGFRFVAEIKARTSPQALLAAAHKAKSYAFDMVGSYPLIIVPYLSPTQLDEVEQLGISAVDLCGNGIVQVPNQWVVVRAGSPNRFRSSEPLRAVYRGVASLVARAFLSRPSFTRVSDVHSFIQERAGAITLATVSKAIARLEEDLIVSRGAEGLRLLQAEKLLSKLRGSYQAPSIHSRLLVKTRVAPAELQERLRVAAHRLGSRFAPTGLSSASKHAVMAVEPVTSFYCSTLPAELLQASAIDASPERHFPDLELLQTDDARVYFDARTLDGDFVASPVQTWLELVTGDKRSQEAADQLRARLLREIGQSKGGVPNVE